MSDKFKRLVDVEILPAWNSPIQLPCVPSPQTIHKALFCSMEGLWCPRSLKKTMSYLSFDSDSTWQPRVKASLKANSKRSIRAKAEELTCLDKTYEWVFHLIKKLVLFIPRNLFVRALLIIWLCIVNILEIQFRGSFASEIQWFDVIRKSLFIVNHTPVSLNIAFVLRIIGV